MTQPAPCLIQIQSKKQKKQKRFISSCGQIVAHSLKLSFYESDIAKRTAVWAMLHFSY